MQIAPWWSNPNEDVHMAITWNRDFDAALEQARTTSKPILLDFSAAPM
jgi:hypothetical protein